MFLVGSRLVQKFINLLDTFASYTGKGGYILRVKTTEDGLEGISIIDAAGKISGAALTLLANIASGAGIIPIANLPTITYAKGGTGLTALGTALQVLMTNAGVTAVEWGTVSAGDMSYADARYKIGTFTRDLTTASGDVSYTGVGFQPKAILFSGGINDSTLVYLVFGFAAGTSGYDIEMETTAGKYQQTNRVIGVTPDNFVNCQLATTKSMDSDGFTLTWTKSGSPTGTLVVNYIAFR